MALPRSSRPYLLPNTPKMLLVALFGVSGIVATPLAARAQDAGPATAEQYRCLPGTSRCATYQCDPTCRRTGAWETRDYSRGVDGDAPSDASVSSSTPTGGYDRRYDSSSQTAQGYDQRYSQSSSGATGSGGYDQRYESGQGGGYDQRYASGQVGASAPTAPGAGYGGGGYGGGGYAGNNYANAYGYNQGQQNPGDYDDGQDSNGRPDAGQGYDQQTYGQESYQNAPGQDEQPPAYGQYGQNGRYQQPPVNPPADADDDDDPGGQDYAANDRATPPPPAYRYSGDAQYRCSPDGYRCAYYRCDPAGDDCHRISGWTSRGDADRRPDAEGW